MTFKKLIWLLPVFIIIFAAGVLTQKQCGRLKQADVTFFHYWDQNFLPIRQAVEKVSQSYNQQNRPGNIHATALDHEAFKVKIQQMDNNPPDLFSYWPGGRVQSLVDKNLLIPIDELWIKKNLDKVFTAPGTINASTYNAKKYVIPVTQFLVSFLYNKELFDRYQLKTPASWDEFLAVCEALKRKGITPIALGGKESWPIQYWYDYLLVRTAGPDFRKKLLTEGRGFNSPESRKAVSLYKLLLDRGYIQKNPLDGDWKDAVLMMAEKKAGMTLMGQWAIGTLNHAGLTEEKDYDFFPFPVIDPAIADSVIGGMDGIILTRDTPAGRDALAYFAGQEAQMELNRGACAICPSSEVPDSFYTPMRLRMKNIFDRSPDWQLGFDVFTSPAIAAAGLNAFYEVTAFPEQYIAILDGLEVTVNKK